MRDMNTKETFLRSHEIQREIRTLPADLYNLARILYCQSGNPALFVPIRDMQYLAVIDIEEIFFFRGHPTIDESKPAAKLRCDRHTNRMSVPRPLRDESRRARG